MVQFAKSMTFVRPVAEVFDFFLQPTNWIVLTPPELHAELVEGPASLQLGSLLTWKGRRWGLPQRLASEVVKLEPNQQLALQQRQGPFRHWLHRLHFTETTQGSQLQEVIEYDPPGGLLGLVVTADFMAKDLESMFRYRTQKLRELLGD